METITAFLESLAKTMPLPLFSFIGSIIDEIVAPIPSPLIPSTMGLLAFEQGQPFSYLFLLALTGTIGKTLASLLTYWVADKLEDLLSTSKIGKLLGLDHEEIEKYGHYFNGSSRDEIIMIILRALPFIPTLPVSVLAGLIKLNLTTYIASTFIGIYLRFMILLVIFYSGSQKYQGLLNVMDATETIIIITAGMTVAGWLFFYLRKRWDRIMAVVVKEKPVEEVIEEE